MPKKLIRRYLPDHHTVRDHKYLRFLGSLLHDPNLWHLNRRSVAGAFAVGLFVAFIPVPVQMVLAAVVAIFLRVNLPVAIALAWITNPLTAAPIYFFTYKLGAWMLGTEPHAFAFEPTLHWFIDKLELIWKPLLLGSLVTGVVSAVVGYFSILLLWRLHIVSKLRDKRRRRASESFSSG